MARQYIEIGVIVENCRFGPNGDGSDETIDQFADGCSAPTAAATDGRRVLVIGRCRRQGDRTRKQPPEPPQMPFAALLDGSKTVVVQDSRSREHAVFKYVGVAGVDQARVVQMGGSAQDMGKR